MFFAIGIGIRNHYTTVRLKQDPLHRLISHGSHMWRSYGKNIDKALPVKKRLTDDPAELQEGISVFCLVRDVCQKQVVAHGHPYLGHDGIPASAEERLDLQVLLVWDGSGVLHPDVFRSFYLKHKTVFLI